MFRLVGFFQFRVDSLYGKKTVFILFVSSSIPLVFISSDPLVLTPFENTKEGLDPKIDNHTLILIKRLSQSVGIKKAESLISAFSLIQNLSGNLKFYFN